MTSAPRAARPHRVLIAHQSTIPHYRIPFYELLERRRPAEWEFSVVYDTRETTRRRIFVEPVDHRDFRFPILDVRTTVIPIGERGIIWQHFLFRASRYDVIVTDTHMTNISYPLSTLHRLRGARHVFWGHMRDMNELNQGRLKRMGQAVKLWLIKRSDCFFAYTEGTRRQAIEAGLDPRRVIALNNTVDIERDRAGFEQLRGDRDAIREELHVTGRKVIIYVGRLLPAKRIPLLLESFERLIAHDNSYHLFVVGGGPMAGAVEEFRSKLGPSLVTAFGPVSDPAHLGRLLTASDAYVLPGFVGLAPLQALCYELPLVVFENQGHSPEFEYLTAGNAMILPEHATAADLAEAIPAVMRRFSSPDRRSSLYTSISHLTLGNMVDRFIAGINAVCGLDHA